MAIDQRAGSKIIKNLRREEAVGSRVEPYPYIGIVKNNLDPTRSGRLQVWIPDLGGAEDEPINWRTVSYSSPYMGYTTNENIADTSDSFSSVSHSYGMWMVPPDIGVHVIVLFIAGDPLRGYWISCVNPNLSHHMIPALAGSTNAIGGKGLPIPVVEFNENKTENVINPAFYNIPKPIHTFQADILRGQGLDQDPVRGAISSSSQRETPSAVFGISTPGRSATNDPAGDETYLDKLNSDTLPLDYFKVSARKGGHTFVMDDGATLGQDQLVRLRTAKGHQILMHDSANTLYISHASGKSWIELTSDGKINAYSQGGFSVRSEGDINLHSDTNININAAKDINIKSGNKIAAETSRTTLLTSSLGIETKEKAELKIGSEFNLETGSSLSLKVASTYVITGQQILFNSGAAKTAPAIKGFNITNKELNTIVTVAPTHEPFNRGVAPSFFNPDNASSGITPQASYTGSYDATKNIAGTAVKTPAGTGDIRNQRNPSKAIGSLTKTQTKAYLTQLGKRESAGSGGYSADNGLGYIGKYQMGIQALQGEEYIAKWVDKNDIAQLNNPNAWTGKDGVKSKADWFNNQTAQESAIESYTQKNYDYMIGNGAITADLAPEEVGGLLATAHIAGATGAKNWRYNKNPPPPDVLGTTPSEYYQLGRYSISVVAPQVSAVDAG